MKVMLRTFLILVGLPLLAQQQTLIGTPPAGAYTYRTEITLRWNMGDATACRLHVTVNPKVGKPFNFQHAVDASGSWTERLVNPTRFQVKCEKKESNVLTYDLKQENIA